MKTKTPLYFSELSPEAQNRALEIYKATEQNTDGLMIKDYFSEKLQEANWPHEEIYYNLSYCQSSSVAFGGENISPEKIAEIARRHFKPHQYQIIKHHANEWNFSIKIKTKAYCSCMSMEIEINYERAYDVDDMADQLITTLVDEIIPKETEKFAKELEEAGYKLIEEHLSDENLKKELLDEYYTFDKKGNLL